MRLALVSLLALAACGGGGSSAVSLAPIYFTDVEGQWQGTLLNAASDPIGIVALYPTTDPQVGQLSLSSPGLASTSVAGDYRIAGATVSSSLLAGTSPFGQLSAVVDPTPRDGSYGSMRGVIVRVDPSTGAEVGRVSFSAERRTPPRRQTLSETHIFTYPDLILQVCVTREAR